MQLQLQEMDSPELIEDVIEDEVLPRVAVKPLLRLRCVSKSWRSLIDSKPFIDKHIQNSARRRSGAIFNHCNKCGPRFSPSYDHPPVDPRLINHDDPEPVGWYAVGHHNGLLCILTERGHKGSFLLSNPATRDVVQLPDPGLVVDKVKLGFGWDKHSDAYKVFLGVPDHENDEGGRVARIYSSGTNSWRALEHGSASLIGKFGVFARGRIYWLTKSGHIEYLDLRNDVFGKTMIDTSCKFKFGDDVRVWLWESRGRLCFVCDTKDGAKRSVWVMKENTWVEDEGVALELGTEVHGVHGAFPYVETLVSPPPLPSPS